MILTFVLNLKKWFFWPLSCVGFLTYLNTAKISHLKTFTLFKNLNVLSERNFLLKKQWGMGALRYGLGRPSKKNLFISQNSKIEIFRTEICYKCYQKRLFLLKLCQIASKPEKSACFPVLRRFQKEFSSFQKLWVWN